MLFAIRSNPTTTILGTAAISKNLKKLKNQNKIRRVGPDKG
jgi:hypothetical protein